MRFTWVWGEEDPAEIYNYECTLYSYGLAITTGKEDGKSFLIGMVMRQVRM